MANMFKKSAYICFFISPILLWLFLYGISIQFYKNYSYIDILSGMLLVTTYSVLRKYIVNKSFFIISQALLFITASLTVMTYAYYSMTTRTYNVTDLFTICDGSSEELADFFCDPILHPLIAFYIFMAVLYWLHEYIFFKYLNTATVLGGHKLPWKTQYILYCICLVCFILIAIKGNIIGLRFPRQLLKEYTLLRRQYQARQKLFFKERIEIEKYLNGKITRKDNRPLTIILVLGESATTEKMHSFGYREANTPFFSGNKSYSGELVLLKRCFSLDNLTHKTVPKILSNQDYTGEAIHNIFIYDICRYLNIKTYMISNQVGNFSAYLETAADYVFFPYKGRRSNESILDKRTPPDDILLPTFSNVIQKLPSEASNLIVIHLFGSHFPFSKRLPADYSTRLERGQLSHEEFEYNKTIEYTDHLLYKIVSFAEKNLKNPFVVCYISDHGEDATRKISRGSRDLKGNIPAFFTVPCAFYFSDSFAKYYPEKIHCLTTNKNNVFINEHIFDAIMALFNVETNDRQITIPEKNIFSSEYEQSINSLKILDGTYPLRSIIDIP